MEPNRREFIGVALGMSALRARGADSASAFHSLTLSEAAQQIRRKTLSPVDLTKACLQRIEQLNPKLNAYITVADHALARARELEQKPWTGPLHGIPLGVKDIFDTAGMRTTAASKVYENRVPDSDAE